MDIVKCKNGHEYNENVWKYCPYCWYNDKIGNGLTEIDDWEAIKNWTPEKF